MTPLRSALFAALIAIVLTPDSLVAQGTNGTGSSQHLRPGRAWRVTLAGDLDAMVLADRLGEVLEDARERNASLVLLELAGDRWRTDVVWAMAQVIHESETPVVALLQDTRDHRVGAGQLMLATMCNQSWIDPDTHVVSTQLDDLGFLAGKDTDWERVHRELAGAIWLKLDERDGPVLLARPLVDQQDAVWLSKNDNADGLDSADSSIITRGEQAGNLGGNLDGNLDGNLVGNLDGNLVGNDTQPIITLGDDGSFTITIDPDQLLELKLIGMIESRRAIILRNAGARSASPLKVDLKSGLNKAHASVWTMLEQLDAIVQAMERLPSPTEPTYQRDRRSIDGQLRRGVQAYRRRLSKLDASLLTYPEIAHMPQPARHNREFEATLASLVKRYEKLKSRR